MMYDVSKYYSIILYVSNNETINVSWRLKIPRPGNECITVYVPVLKFLKNKTKLSKKLIRFQMLFICQRNILYYSRRRSHGPFPPGKQNIAVRAVGHVFQYGIILPYHTPFTTQPQSAARQCLLICISSRSNFKRRHNIIIMYLIRWQQRRNMLRV